MHDLLKLHFDLGQYFIGTGVMLHRFTLQSCSCFLIIRQTDTIQWTIPPKEIELDLGNLFLCLLVRRKILSGNKVNT